MSQGRYEGRILKEGRKEGKAENAKGRENGRRGRGVRERKSMNSNLQLGQKTRGWLVDLEADEPTSDVQPGYAGTS